jgi:hypothetical protein
MLSAISDAMEAEDLVDPELAAELGRACFLGFVMQSIDEGRVAFLDSLSPAYPLNVVLRGPLLVSLLLLLA